MGRSFLVSVLVGLAVALLTIGNVLFWTGNSLVKQDRFEAAVKPVIKDPVVQQTLALYTTDQLYSNVNVQQKVETVLPPRADFLAPQLSQQLRTVTQSTLQKALAKPKFQDTFNNVISRQHQRLINLAANYKGDGTVSLDDVYNRLVANLKDTRLAFLAEKQLPAKTGDIVIVRAPRLPLFHKVVTNIDLWRNLTLGAMIILLSIGVWLSRNRRRTIYLFGGFSAMLMIATLASLRLATTQIAGHAQTQYAEGVRRVIEILTQPLVVQTVTIFAAAIALGLIAWLGGNSRRSAQIKQRVSLLMGGKLHASLFGKRMPGWAKWVQLHKRSLDWIALLALTAVLLLAQLTVSSLLIYLLVLVVVVLLIELIAGDPPKRNRRK